MAAPPISLAAGPWTGAEPSSPLTGWIGEGSITWSLDSGATLQLAVDGVSVDAQVFDGLATDVWVYKSGVLWHRLRTLPIAQEWGPDGEDVASIECVSYKQLVRWRHIYGPTAPVFTNVDQGEIIWALVNATQSTAGGSLGITKGVVATGILRTRSEYLVGDELGKVIGDLEGVINGPWWDVDAQRVLTVKQLSTMPTHPTPAVLGTNVRGITRKPSLGFANVSGAVGSSPQGSGAVAEDGTVPHWAVSPTLVGDPRGRWEIFDASHTSVTEQARVVEYAVGNLAAAQNPPTAWTVEVDPDKFFGGDSNYSVGEKLNVTIPSSALDPVGPPPLNTLVQISEIRVGFNADGATEVVITGVEVES